MLPISSRLRVSYTRKVSMSGHRSIGEWAAKVGIQQLLTMFVRLLSLSCSAEVAIRSGR